MKLELESMEIDGFRDLGPNQKVIFPRNSVSSILGKNDDDGGSNASGKTSFIMSVPVNIYGPKIVGIASADLKNWHLKQPARLVGRYLVDGESLVIDRTIGGKLLYCYKGSDWVTGGVEDVQKKINEILKITSEQFMALSHKPQEDSTSFLLKDDADKKDFLSSFFDVSQYEKAKEKVDASYTAKGKELAALVGKCQVLEAQYKDCEQNIKDARASLEMLETFGQVEKHDINLQQLTALERDIAALETASNTKEFFKNHPHYVTAESVHMQLQQKNADSLALLDKDVSTCEEQVKTLMIQLVAPIVVPDDLLKPLQDINTALKNVEDCLNRSNILSMQAITSKNQIVTILKGMKNINDPRHTDCDQCGQKLLNAAAIQAHIQKHNDDLIAKAKTTEEDMNRYLADRAALNVSENDKIALTQLRDQKNAEIAEFKARFSNENLTKEIVASRTQLQQLKTIKASLTNEIATSQNNLNRILSDLVQKSVTDLQTLRISKMTISREIENRENSLKAAQGTLDKATVKLKELQIQLLDVASGRIDLEIELKVLEKSSYVLSKSGFFGFIFDGILEDLNKEININLKMIPNVRQYSLQFTPDKLVKTTGNMSKVITFEIKNGKRDVAFKPLSGGEKLGLIISVDEALDTVLSRRLGVHIGWKILDEQFTWIDSNSKEAILEFYRSKSHNKSYFIVDHASEFNAAVDSRILVRKKNGIAQVEQ